MNRSRPFRPFYRWILASLSFSLALPVSAELITFDFTGHVKSIDSQIRLNDSVQVGTPFTGSYTFDSKAPGIDYTNHFMYTVRAPGSGIQAILGNYILQSDPEHPDMWIDVINNSPDFDKDGYGVGSRRNLSLPGLDVIVLDPIWLSDPSETALNTNALPLIPPDLKSFAHRTGQITFIQSNTAFQANISTTVDSLTLRGGNAIPEPGSLALLSFTALPLSALWARRRSVAVGRC